MAAKDPKTKKVRFTTVLELNGKTATGMAVPPELVEQLGAGKRPPVKVTINGYTYRSTVAVMGGRSLIGVNAENRAAAGAAAGDQLDVTLELDTAPRTVEVPRDLAKALKAAGAREAFDKLSYTHRKEHVRAIEEAKAPETRQRRIDKAVEMVTAKK
jgi:uncharacterized protein YdeI (YjbR/CyaY-like superfamily)